MCRPNSLIFLVVLTTSMAGSVAAPAQEWVRSSEGRVSLAVPEPVFLPENAVALIQMAGFSRLGEKIAALTEGFLNRRELLGALASFERIILSDRGFPGIHPTRPFFLALYDPAQMDAKVAPPSSWQDLMGVLGFGVAAIPVSEPALYLGTLGTRLKFVGKRDDGVLRYLHIESEFDYEAWTAANRQGSISTLSSDDAARQFTRSTETEILVVLRPGYALLTANPDIAVDCLAADDHATWRALPAAAELTHENSEDLPRGHLVDNGRMIRAGDDVVISLRVARLYETHRERLEASLAQLRQMDDVADPARDTGQSTFSTAEAAEFMNVYLDFVLSSLRAIDTLEISVAERNGGLQISTSIRPLPDSPIAEWLSTPAPSASTADLFTLLPGNFTLIGAMNSRFDESMLRFYADFLRTFAPGAPEHGVEDEISAWVKEATEAAKHYTGRAAFACDVSRQAGFSMVQVTELEPGDQHVHRLAGVLGPQTIWSRLAHQAGSFQLKPLPPRTIGGIPVEAMVMDVSGIAKTAANRQMYELFSGFEINFGVIGRFVVLTAGRDSVLRFSETARRIHQHRLVSPIAVARRLNTRKFTADSRFIAEINILRLIASSLDATPLENSQGRRAFLTALNNLAETNRGEGIGVCASNCSANATLSFHISRNVLRSIQSLTEIMDAAKRTQVTENSLETLTGVLRRYQQTNGTFPSDQDGLDVLLLSTGKQPAPLPDYQRHMLMDGWGNPVRYGHNARGRPYLMSFGQDGVSGGSGFDADLVILLN